MILVTGGAGFIGGHLIEQLVKDKNNQVISLDNYFTGSKVNHIAGADPMDQFGLGHAQQLNPAGKFHFCVGSLRTCDAGHRKRLDPDGCKLAKPFGLRDFGRVDQSHLRKTSGLKKFRHRLRR